MMGWVSHHATWGWVCTKLYMYAHAMWPYRHIDYTTNCKAIDTEEHLNMMQHPHVSPIQSNQSLEKTILCEQEEISQGTADTDTHSRFHALKTQVQAQVTKFIMSTNGVIRLPMESRDASSLVAKDVASIQPVSLRLCLIEYTWGSSIDLLAVSSNLHDFWRTSSQENEQQQSTQHQLQCLVTCTDNGDLTNRLKKVNWDKRQVCRRLHLVLWHLQVTGFFKIIITYIQVIMTFETNLSVPWPESFIKIMQSIAILSFNVFNLGFNCVFTYDFYLRFWFRVVLHVQFWTFSRVRCQRHDTGLGDGNGSNCYLGAHFRNFSLLRASMQWILAVSFRQSNALI